MPKTTLVWFRQDLRLAEAWEGGSRSAAPDWSRNATPHPQSPNPVQATRFDPQGTYVREWVPEFALLPSEWIHHPWEAPSRVLAAAGVRLGTSYPQRPVDHETARTEAPEALATLKK